MMACWATTTLAVLWARAEVVHVVEQVKAGETTVVRDVLAETGVAFQSATPPAVSGFIFTHWTISTAQPFVNRDVWGRAKDSVSFVLYEPTILTANYVAADVDSDQDGLADGDELYWYGDLDEGALSDTDGDGVTFKGELESGTNPHFADGADKFGVVYDGINDITYNPLSYPVYIFRSEPEGALFETVTAVAEPGTVVRSPICSQGTTFAYWKVGENICRDAFGRALDQVSFEMPSNDVVAVAVCIADAGLRAQYYWYGRQMAMSSDTDGDGHTLAEELEQGTNPLFPDDDGSVGVVYDGINDALYNPLGLKPYVVKSTDDGLFEPFTEYALPGTTVTTPTLDSSGSAFAYWTVDGVIQRDAFGRALDAASCAVPSSGVELVAHVVRDAADRAKLYWYGTTEVELTSDTDGDGLTLAEEIANGTNPLFADSDRLGGVEYDGLDDVEVNLQSHEKVDGFVIDGKYVKLSLGKAVQPVVADVNGDGLWDVVLVYEDGVKVLVNVGGKGNPAFRVGTDVEVRAVQDETLAMNSTEKLTTMSLDVPPVGALSATVWGDETLLISDREGRIWYYMSSEPLNFTLQHKVWGGSFAGFAQGLRIAAVDWDDDGDLDCLCGTADGKLVLLRDPKIGRPTNLRASAGVDNVKLDWEPNQQSRIRGYKVYRSDEVIAEPTLPTYRDYPPGVSDYDYAVSAVSRRYVTGNSTPIVNESPKTEPVRVSLGKVEITVGDPMETVDGRVEIVVSINNSMNYKAAGTSIRVPYDAEKFAYQSTRTSGLSEKLVYKTTTEGGVATIDISSGEVASGAGAFFTLVFKGSAQTLKGDVNGDGKVDALDIRLLLNLYNVSPKGRKPTEEEVNAGDLTGDGKLDKSDHQALRALLKEKGIL